MAKKTKKRERISFDVSNHILVPHHSKLGDKEKKELFEKYNLSSRDLPKIAVSDPALQNLEVKQGDIIKVTRKSLTAGTISFYRGVIDG